MSEESLRVNLLDFDRDGLIEYCESLGEKRFRAIQLLRWIHRHCVGDFSQMTDLAKAFRAKLETNCEICAPRPIWDKLSADGTRKWLFDVGNVKQLSKIFTDIYKNKVDKDNMIDCATESLYRFESKVINKQIMDLL